MENNRELMNDSKNAYSYENVGNALGIEFSPSFILDYNSALEEYFTNFYTKRGYVEHNPEPVQSRIDDSVLFIGSSINVLKPMLNSGIPKNGVFINQPCLRTQNQRIFYNDNEEFEYNSYFHTSSVLAPIESINKVTLDAVDFVKNIPEVNDSRMLIKVSSRDIDLIESIKSVGLANRMEIDTADLDYYDWTYGKEGMNGRGLTIAIKNNAGDYRDIGNIIVIEEDGSPTAVEWGYGTETMLSRIYSLEQPLEASQVSSVIPYESGMKAKFADTFCATIEMYRANVKPGKSGQSFILKDYIKGLSYLRRKLDLPMDLIKEYTHKYIENIYSIDSTYISENLIDRIKIHEEKVIDLESRIIEMSKTSSISELKNLALKSDYWRNEFGVNPKEVDMFINKLA